MNNMFFLISLFFLCASFCATTSYSTTDSNHSASTATTDSALGSPINGNQVVVFVHGFRGFGDSIQLGGESEDGKGFTCEMGIQQLQLDDDGKIINIAQVQPFMVDADAQGMPIWLNELGFDVWFAHYTTGVVGTSPMVENSACLAQQIAEVSGYDAEGKVTIIAASLGGLVSRYYLENEAHFQPYAENVEKIFTLGSPHKGLPIGILVYFAVQLGLDCSVGQAPICDIASSNIRRLNRKDRAPGVEYYFIGGAAPYSNFNKTKNRWIYYFLRLWGSNDGLVLSRSARGIRTHLFDYKIRGITGRLKTNESHAPDIGLNSYTVTRTDGTKSTTYLKCILPVLTGGDPECI